MPTIDSVELYLGLSSARSGWNVIVDIRDFGGYSINPEQTDSLGTKSLDVVNVPLNSGSGPDWVTFEFDTPITLPTDRDYIGLLVSTTAPSAYQATPLRWYYAQDWDLAPQVPPEGGEKFYSYWSGSWHSYTATCLAYKINCTGCDDNDATNPSASYFNFGSYSKNGHRSHINTLVPPEKPINPTPEHESSDITLDATGVSWENGGGATSYNIYYGTLSGFLTLLESDVTDLSYTLRSTNWPSYDQAWYWRVDAVNDYGTTTGDEWYFTTLIFSPPTPSGITWTDPGNSDGHTGQATGLNNMITCKRLVAASDNCLWVEV